MIPDAALDERLAIVGTAGSGKTYAAGVLAERLLAMSGTRAIIADPLGVWWGLRLRDDGKTPSVFSAVIFGGPHGDLPVTEHSGALIGETVATMAESCILDLSNIGTKAGERRFMLAFLTALYRKTTGEPVHVIFDEADMWAPQRLLDKDGEAAKLLGMMETIVRRGRVKGFVPWLITQRPAVLSKDILSQSDGLIAFKLTSPQDRTAIGDWVQGHADHEQWKKMWGDLATMKRGQGIVWLPARGVLKTMQFPVKTTFDSSRTPKRGEKRNAAVLKPLDLGALKARLSTVEAEVKANDPRALRAEIARLKSESQKHIVADPAVIEQAEKRGWDYGYDEGHKDGYTNALIAARQAVESVPFPKRPERPVALLPKPRGAIRQSISSQSAPSSGKRIIRAAREALAIARGPLPLGETMILVAAAQFNGASREQLSVITGYKRSSRDAYIARLKEKGLVATNGQVVTPTPDGMASLPQDYEPLPVGRALQEYWLNRLPEGEKRILAVLLDAFPNAVARQSLDDATGYKRSSRDAYLARMKAKRLITTEGSAVWASNNLF